MINTHIRVYTLSITLAERAPPGCVGRAHCTRENTAHIYNIGARRSHRIAIAIRYSSRLCWWCGATAASMRFVYLKCYIQICREYDRHTSAPDCIYTVYIGAVLICARRRHLRSEKKNKSTQDFCNQIFVWHLGGARLLQLMLHLYICIQYAIYVRRVCLIELWGPACAEEDAAFPQYIG